MRDHKPDLEQELERLRDQLRNLHDETLRDELLQAVRKVADQLTRKSRVGYHAGAT